MYHSKPKFFQAVYRPKLRYTDYSLAGVTGNYSIWGMVPKYHKHIGFQTWWLDLRVCTSLKDAFSQQRLDVAFGINTCPGYGLEQRFPNRGLLTAGESPQTDPAEKKFGKRWSRV
ncbi:hypothetical protein QTP88_004873 [Uroleucon formosanum]